MKNVNNKKTLTIGIPAFNEEANIANLLHEILLQKQENYCLKKIIVASDGSTDNTVKAAASVDHPGLLILDNYFRKGVSSRQNQIISYTNTDILVILNADTLPKDSLFIENLIKPILNRQSDLTSSSLEEISPKNFVEETIAVSNIFKRQLFGNYKKGSNIYTCKGTARAFSKRLYKKIDFKNFSAEDAHSYLFAVKFGYKYQFAKNAIAIYKLPDNVSDHLRQSLRFNYSREELISEYGLPFVARQYRIPIFHALISFLNIFFQYPVHTIFYLMLLGYSKAKYYLLPQLHQQGTWQVSSSTKDLGYGHD